MPESSAKDNPLKDVRVGMSFSVTETVTVEATVGHHVPGMPLVYATPAMIMAMEKAAYQAVAAHLPPGWVTVGAHVDLRHLAPTPVGRTVTATARVIEVERMSVLFAVEAHDGVRRIGEGQHRRGAVDLARFAARRGG